jgi:hypothetical protein
VGFLASCAISLSGCGLFDSGIVWRDGRYALMWIDLPDEVTLSYRLGEGGSLPLVAPRVFAVGANERYVVAKQHPAGDRKITNYFIIDREKDDIRSLESSVTGPMTEREFQALATELALPPFSRVLAALE